MLNLSFALLVLNLAIWAASGYLCIHSYLWWKHIKLLHYNTSAQGRGTTLTLQTYNVSFFTHRNHEDTVCHPRSLEMTLSEQIDCSKLVGGSWSTTPKCTGPLGRICIDPIRTNQDCTPRGRRFSSVEPLLSVVLSPLFLHTLMLSDLKEPVLRRTPNYPPSV